ncbi:MAG: acyltransferase [Oscillospiraceae bacterium]|nr:acyltransferase [Oscillospiraceae bacterium]
MSFLKSFIRKLLGRMNSDDLNRYLQKHDVTVGKKTVFFEAHSCFIDVQRPWMLSIGSYCKITRGTIILQHDYSRSVLRRAYGEVLDVCKQAKIGNNVFIGMNSIILMGTTIGDNVIVGAGSVVSGTIPSNCVVAGNPAKVIRTLDEHYEIIKRRNCEHAIETAAVFIQRYHRDPTIEEMGAFFPLYLERSREALEKNHIRTALSGDEENEVVEAFLNSKPQFADYDAFLQEVHKRV